MSRSLSGRTLRWLLVALGLALAVRQWVWMPALVTGDSMQPTMHGVQFVGINKLVYRRGRPRRGEIVAVWTGSGLTIKRVIGLPGEDIGLRDGIFSINGTPLIEPYVQFHDVNSIAPGLLGPDLYVVAGDNRCETFIAVVNRDRIVGRVLRKKWRYGFSQAGGIHGNFAAVAYSNERGNTGAVSYTCDR